MLSYEKQTNVIEVIILDWKNNVYNVLKTCYYSCKLFKHVIGQHTLQELS